MPVPITFVAPAFGSIAPAGTSVEIPQDASGRIYPGAACYVLTSGPPDTVQFVDATHGMPTTMATGLDPVNDAVRVNGVLDGLVDGAGNGLVIHSFQGSPSSSGVNPLVGAQGAGKRIYVLAYTIQGGGTVNAQFADTTPANLQPAWSLGGTSPAVAGVSRTAARGNYLFATAANQGLNLVLSGAVGVNVALEYVVAG